MSEELLVKFVDTASVVDVAFRDFCHASKDDLGMEVPFVISGDRLSSPELTASADTDKPSMKASRKVRIL